MQNGFVERFIDPRRVVLPNDTMSLNHAHERVKIAAWVADDNTGRLL